MTIVIESYYALRLPRPASWITTMSRMSSGQHAWRGWETGSMSWYEFCGRVSSTTPTPDTSVLTLIGFAALASVILAWPLVRMLVTVCHEAGHAVAATVTGRSLEGIRLHSDTSGLTVSRGAPKGAGMVVTLFAGYPAASLVGLTAAFVAGAGFAVAMVSLLVVALALMLLKIRNMHGALVVVTLGAALGLAAWYVPVAFVGWLAYGLAWLRCWRAPTGTRLALTRAGRLQDRAQRSWPGSPAYPDGLDRPLAGRHGGSADLGHRHHGARRAAITS